MNTQKTMRQVILEALHRLDPQTLAGVLSWLALLVGAVLCAWLYLVWKLAQLWKGCL